MKISYNWLKEYINIDLDIDTVAEILTNTGLEVEGVEKIEGVKGGLRGVVIGEVVDCEKHPDADRLKVTRVDIGDEELQIVCGAPNVAKGQKVVVATVGCTLYPKPDEAFKIKKSKIRGVESFGMICAEDELGLGNDHDGIMVLEESAIPGTPASEFFQLEDDYLIEIGLTPNRSDAMGHIGVARDLKAFLNVHESSNLKLNFPNISNFNVDDESLVIDVEVKQKDLCPRYTGLSIAGVEIKDSPEWLQKRLRSIGLSPINNVVDVTNYVMHELGNPLHAFDADKVKGKIVVETAKEGEKFVTLDGVERTLTSEDLMITNGKENLCIAGVMGGLDSGVSNQTKNIFLEAAYFNPVSVRKTAKRHGISTDSSFRFERGVDPNMVLFALKRAALLIKEVAGGTVSMQVTDTHPEVFQGPKIQLNYDRCQKLIGEQIPKETIKKILNELDFQILEDKEEGIVVQSPTFRVDVTREADLIEEILRIYGFNKISLPEKLNTSITYSQKPDLEKIQTIVSEMLVGMGFFEMMNNSLTKSKYITDSQGDTVKPENSVAILNPLSQDLDVMRQSMIFGVLETVLYNQNRQNPNLKLFEFGKIYQKFEDGYFENKRLTIAITGLKQVENWNSNKDKVSFYTIKAVAKNILKRLGLSSLLKFKPLKKSLLEDGLQCYILKKKVGEIGWLPNKMKKQFGVKGDVFVADLDWDAVIESLKFTSVKYHEIPKTFAVRRDFSLLLDEKVSFSEIEEIAKSCDKRILQEVGLFDVYEGDKLEKGKKSYAVSFIFQDAEKTLKDKQVDAVMDKIRVQLEKKLNAQLR